MLRTRRAVKLLAPELTRDARLVQRFVDDARATAVLHHRNLIHVHDVGQLASGAWFMALDYLEGDTLGRFIASYRGPIPPQVIVHIVCEIANGLQAAHDRGLTHRGLRPETVLLTNIDGDPYRAVVVDLGVAQLAGERAAPIYLDPLVAARIAAAGLAPPQHLAYLTPERLREADAAGVWREPGARFSDGAAADRFALGVIAYQMTTGGWFPDQRSEAQLVFRSLPASELVARQLAGPPVDPRERCERIGDAWALAVLDAVSRDPARRPASARAFALRLAAALPAIGMDYDGPSIVRTYARELVSTGGLDPFAVPRPRIAPSIAAAPAPSAVIDAGARYQLGDKLGTGGMAEVFIGTMVGVEGFARRVAIKRVLAGLSHLPAFATMFVSEAQIASRLAHPNIVSVLDFSRDLEDRLFLVMEHVDGVDLASLLASGPVAPSLAIYIIVELLRGLGYAHAVCDVVHRDVSPQNVLLCNAGSVKVTDFGLAKVRAASDGVWSATVRGKPSYMSPEQVAGDVLDHRTDLYSVGVILWEMLTHRPLFAGTTKEILGQVMFREIAKPSAVHAGVPADLQAIAMTLLSRDRDERFPTAESAIEALLCCAHAPRDGRGELVYELAERFARHTGARVPRRSAAPMLIKHAAGQQITQSEPHSAVHTALEQVAASGSLPALVRPRRRWFGAAISGVVLGGIAAALRALVPTGRPRESDSANQEGAR